MPRHLTIAIDLELTEPVSGSVVCGDAKPIRFRGWFQLHSTLESICVAAQPEPSGGARDGGSPQ